MGRKNSEVDWDRFYIGYRALESGSVLVHGEKEFREGVNGNLLFGYKVCDVIWMNGTKESRYEQECER